MSVDTATAASALPELPTGWRAVSVSGPGPFVTRAQLEGPGGERMEWTSRRHRKGLGLLAARRERRRAILAHASPASWAMAAFFGVGSLCFAVGSFPPYFQNVSVAVAAWTFFVGSVFFTTAAYLQFHEVLRAPATVTGPARAGHLRTLIGWRPRSIDWWATAVQLVGTVFFNVSTFAATRAELTLGQTRRLVWAPDVFGSICFLVASWLSYAEVNRGILPRGDGSTGWRIAALNLVGSIAFGASAVAARLLPTTGEVANITVVNLGTFAGALCFLAGAALLPVESSRDRAA